MQYYLINWLHDFLSDGFLSHVLLLFLPTMPLHHLMIGTWTPPGAIFTVQFDDEALTLKLVKRTEIPHDEPISWMAFDVCTGSFTTLKAMTSC